MTVAVQFTLAETATILDPPLTETQLRQLVTLLGVQPAGVRRTGHVGRPRTSAHTYDYEELSALHKALLPFLRGAHVTCVVPMSPSGVSGYDLGSRPDCPKAGGLR